jgi:nuclear pore complex protein Nup107
LSKDDKKKIDALDWIVHETTQRVKLLEYGNQIMRYFLLAKQNVDAIKIILAKIPNDTLNLILTQYRCKTTEALSDKIRNIIKEYICFKEYVEGINCFNEWFEGFNQKPAKQAEAESSLSINTTTSTTLSFSDRITYDYQQKQYDDQLAKWSAKTQQLCDKAKKKLYGILMFPNGGWMTDALKDSLIDDDDEDERMMTGDGDDESARNDKVRLSQMHALRKFYIPYMCFVLCEMLNKSNLNKEQLKLVDLIASENYKLYELFDKAQLRTLLLKSANASIHLLDTKFDFMGY